MSTQYLLGASPLSPAHPSSLRDLRRHQPAGHTQFLAIRMSWLPLTSNVPCNVPSRSVLLRLLECLCFVFCLVWFCFQVTGSWAGCLWTPSTFWPDSCRACNLFLPLHGFPVLTSFQEPTSEIFSILRIYISTHEIFSISTLLYQALTLALLSR